jgi:aspartate aminotransferase-like enzyme
MASWNPLLDAPAYPAAGYARLAGRLGALLDTRNDVLLVQGEAIVALEAAATSLARPGLAALNIVTSPYGSWFGAWLRRGGAEVVDLVAPPGRPIAAAAIAAALAERPAGLVALVHAESASGILNPLPEIAALAQSSGALLVVDAVASFGGHALSVDALGADIVVVGPQKSLGGAAGVSAVAVSPRAWGQIAAPGAVALSTLALADLRANWLDAGRGALPGMPSPIEFHTLEATLDRFEAEGLAAAIHRHHLAAAATRAALAALPLVPWVPAAEASNLVTAAQLPAGIDRAALLAALAPFGTGIAAGIGPGTERLLRLNHTGPRASFAPVLANVVALGAALRQAGADSDTGAAAAAVATAYGAAA